MISDVLSDAVISINTYLEEYPEIYSGDLRERIIKVRDEMTAIQRELDTPPNLPDISPTH